VVHATLSSSARLLKNGAGGDSDDAVVSGNGCPATGHQLTHSQQHSYLPVSSCGSCRSGARFVLRQRCWVGGQCATPSAFSTRASSLIRSKRCVIFVVKQHRLGPCDQTHSACLPVRDERIVRPMPIWSEAQQQGIVGQGRRPDLYFRHGHVPRSHIFFAACDNMSRSRKITQQLIKIEMSSKLLNRPGMPPIPQVTGPFWQDPGVTQGGSIFAGPVGSLRKIGSSFSFGERQQRRSESQKRQCTAPSSTVSVTTFRCAQLSRISLKMRETVLFFDRLTFHFYLSCFSKLLL